MRLRTVVTALLMVGGLLVVGGCTSAPSQEADPAALEGVTWQLTGSEVSEVELGDAGINIAFDGEMATGFSGVNQYGGSYTAETNGSLEFGMMNSTLMAGPEDLMAAEAAYMSLLRACDSFAVSDGTLTLSAGGEAQLVFEAGEAASLPDSSWVVTGYNNGNEAVVSPAVGTTLTIDFGSDGNVGGNGGVNTFRGTFTTTEDTIEFGPLATTKMAGEPEHMTQETAFLGALANATTWSVTSRGMLELRDAGGATQVVATPAATEGE